MKFITENIEKAILDFDETLKMILSKITLQKNVIETSKEKINLAIEEIKNLNVEQADK